MGEISVQIRKTAVILCRYCSLGYRDLHYHNEDSIELYESSYNDQGYKKCVLWIWISINSRNRRAKKKELTRSVDLKYR